MRQLALALALLVWPTFGCQGSPSRDQETRTEKAGASDALEIVAAPGSGDVAALVAAEIARRPERTVLVYVSASWCEPCVHLEEAVASGQLEDEFPGLELFKFDYDRDEDRLAQAGYTADLIPLLVIPEPDGRAGQRRMEGSIKGPEAVATNLVPRLHVLLGR